MCSGNFVQSYVKGYKLMHIVSNPTEKKKKNPAEIIRIGQVLKIVCTVAYVLILLKNKLTHLKSAGSLNQLITLFTCDIFTCRS
jgi:hypothetical protein